MESITAPSAVTVGAPSSIKPVPVVAPSSIKAVPVVAPSSVKAVAAGGPGNVTPTHQEVGQALVAQPGTAAEDENKNPWVLVTYRNTGRVHRQGGQVLQVVYELPDLECQVGVPWVQTGCSIRAKRKLSMARKGGMTVTSDGEDAIWLYGSYALSNTDQDPGNPRCCWLIRSLVVLAVADLLRLLRSPPLLFLTLLHRLPFVATLLRYRARPCG